ncbi:recombinase family protein [Rhodococcus sp. RDE2]|uniref:recombinase family protein n=1 Tax=Rhodococcus sp. RDE2 TaxID=2885078 RepID=UPI001E3ABEDF|nr:recombinase family protein [Rhodococcus sp. RDE2]BDB59575.1 serine recombinase [Rhodococcus sp. RDE2]
MRALIYARVSSDPSGRGRSVADQIVDCREICHRNGWTIVDELQDNDIGASRWSKKDRPEYRRLHQLLSEADVLVTWEASRALRDLAAYLELRDLCTEHGVQWCYSGQVYDLNRGDDRFRTGLDALLSENEAEKMRERVLRGLRSRAAAGEPHGKVPYGYKAALDDNGHRIRVPHPEEAQVIRDAAKMLRAGESLRAIVRRLNSEGRMNRGRPWSAIEIRRKLLSPTYAGYRVHHGTQVLATWESILSTEDHQAITAILKDPERLTQRGSDPVHLLTGIAVCGECGTPVVRRKNASGTSSYTCSAKYCVTRSKPIVDEVVEAVIVARLAQPDVAEALRAGDGSQRREALAEIRVLKERLAAYEQKAIEGDLEPDEYTRIRDGLRAKLADAEARADNFTGGSPLPRQIAGPNAAELWESLAIDAKRSVIRALCRVYIDKAPRNDTANPKYIRIEWKA